jgi:hypothetical protein
MIRHLLRCRARGWSVSWLWRAGRGKQLGVEVGAYIVDQPAPVCVNVAGWELGRQRCDRWIGTS